ncbi:unnamed protein product [Polarella glacialis]|uniref:Uncharacterized protein n=2 Tax=Polarella glacialis TaxID=89957 RepID=A0A813E221_POLGL|nr:unnamed protein product [Polarella glacialis]CAE8664282.1 unnamed protein product [Polarella glacialis]
MTDAQAKKPKTLQASQGDHDYSGHLVIRLHNIYREEEFNFLEVWEAAVKRAVEAAGHELQPPIGPCVLCLDGLRLTDECIAEMVRWLLQWGAFPVKIFLHQNSITSRGVSSLTQLLNRIDDLGHPLKELHLSHNQINDHGVRMLFSAAIAFGPRSPPLWCRLEQNLVEDASQICASMPGVCFLPEGCKPRRCSCQADSYAACSVQSPHFLDQAAGSRANSVPPAAAANSKAAAWHVLGPHVPLACVPPAVPSSSDQSEEASRSITRKRPQQPSQPPPGYVVQSKSQPVMRMPPELAVTPPPSKASPMTSPEMMKIFSPSASSAACDQAMESERLNPLALLTAKLGGTPVPKPAPKQQPKQPREPTEPPPAWLAEQQQQSQNNNKNDNLPDTPPWRAAADAAPVPGAQSGPSPPWRSNAAKKQGMSKAARKELKKSASSSSGSWEHQPKVLQPMASENSDDEPLRLKLKQESGTSEDERNLKDEDKELTGVKTEEDHSVMASKNIAWESRWQEADDDLEAPGRFLFLLRTPVLDEQLVYDPVEGCMRRKDGDGSRSPSSVRDRTPSSEGGQGGRTSRDASVRSRSRGRSRSRSAGSDLPKHRSPSSSSRGSRSVHTPTRAVELYGMANGTPSAARARGVHKATGGKKRKKRDVCDEPWRKRLWGGGATARSAREETKDEAKPRPKIQPKARPKPAISRQSEAASSTDRIFWERVVDVSELRYCQRTIKKLFRDGRSLHTLVTQLKSGEVDPMTADFLKLTVMERPERGGGSSFFSKDNRRLWCLKELQRIRDGSPVPVRVKFVSWAVQQDHWVLQEELRRFSANNDTQNGGYDVILRG